MLLALIRGGVLAPRPRHQSHHPAQRRQHPAAHCVQQPKRRVANPFDHGQPWNTGHQRQTRQ